MRLLGGQPSDTDQPQGAGAATRLGAWLPLAEGLGLEPAAHHVDAVREGLARDRDGMPLPILGDADDKAGTGDLLGDPLLAGPAVIREPMECHAPTPSERVRRKEPHAPACIDEVRVEVTDAALLELRGRLHRFGEVEERPQRPAQARWAMGQCERQGCDIADGARPHPPQVAAQKGDRAHRLQGRRPAGLGAVGLGEQLRGAGGAEAQRLHANPLPAQRLDLTSDEDVGEGGVAAYHDPYMGRLAHLRVPGREESRQASTHRSSSPRRELLRAPWMSKRRSS